MPGLGPDLGPGGALVGERVGRVIELVGEEGARNAGGKPGRHVLVVGRMTLADVGARHVHLGAERLQMQHLLARHLVRNDEHDAVALGARHQRQAEAGVAGGRLDHRAAGAEPAVALGGVDHRQADSVLDRAARVLRLELEEELARPGVEARHAHQRRVADQRKDRGRLVGRRHLGRSLAGRCRVIAGLSTDRL